MAMLVTVVETIIGTGHGGIALGMVIIMSLRWMAAEGVKYAAQKFDIFMWRV